MYIIYSYSYLCLTNFLAAPKNIFFIVEDIGGLEQPAPYEVTYRRHPRVKIIIKIKAI